MAKGRVRLNGQVERTRDAVARLAAEGRTLTEIAAELGLSKSTIAYHLRNAGVPADRRFSKRYDWQEIQRAYEGGMSQRECAELFGFTSATRFQAVVRGDIRPRPRAMPIEKLLVADRPQTNRTHLKMRLLAEGLKENRCERCGLDEWRGEPLNVQLHHINGVGKDNRLENIEFLCPNCHALTENWGGRNCERRRRGA